MQIIISPAKKMRTDTDSFIWKDLPVFLSRTEVIFTELKKLSYEELKALWKCNDKIAAQNVERLQTLDLHKALTPAVMAYEGIQYQYMAPGVFSQEELAYVQDHLRILSGFYGLLRPFDGVIPYRLEMQAIPCAFFLATVLAKKMRGSEFFKFVFFAPIVISIYISPLK